MSIKVVKSGYERGKYKPVQAYIDTGVLARFNNIYQSHGDITKLIRNAFVIAINEDEQTEEAAKQAVETMLPDAPETVTIELPCEDCVYPEICVTESTCAVSNLQRKIDAARNGGA